jgi:hypothetical protein
LKHPVEECIGKKIKVVVLLLDGLPSIDCHIEDYEKDAY